MFKIVPPNEADKKCVTLGPPSWSARALVDYLVKPVASAGVRTTDVMAHPRGKNPQS